MIKRVTVLRHLDGVDRDDAVAHWTTAHAPLIERIPGVIRYVQRPGAHRADAGGDPQLLGIGEVWFATWEDAIASTSTSEWTAVLDDAATFVELPPVAVCWVQESEVPSGGQDIGRAASAAARRTVSTPAVLLRLEGAALAAAAIWGFHTLGASWRLFAALALAPDLGLLGYLAGPRTGARAYNATHTLLAPLVFGGIGIATGWTWAVVVASVWIAHIGIDRLVGYGLKYPDDFRRTHLQRVA